MNLIPKPLCQAALALVLLVLAHLSGTPCALAATNTGTFVEESIGGTWNEAVGLTFNAEGQMFVWERGGRLWLVENGIKQSQPLLDISEEVGSWHDHGLMGVALHPDFLNNGYVYLLYVVDHYYLRNYGRPNYNSSSNEYFTATIGRITRYTARTNDHFHSIDPNSRTILLGETIDTGFPILYTSHGLGSLAFGEDGTLLASCGDGGTQKAADMGSASGTYFAQALAEGIIQPRENVGSFRAQMTSTLAGKILRLDAATGDGLPSNPFFDAANPRSARSRIWALGLRQPFRLTVRPGTGSHFRADGRPGVIYIGDVGWLTWEELDVCKGPGLNFGWPLFEGLESQSAFASGNIANQDAPNPLSGVGGCTQQFFYFRDLLKQATLGTVSWPNPCNPAQQIPTNIYRFVHTRPVMDWKQPSGPSRTGIFTGTNAAVINIGASGSPVAGVQFAGNCSIGGVWYTNSDFPSIYRNTYFHADYGAQWIKNVVFDQNDAPVEVRNFSTNVGGIVFLATHPIDGGLYYISWTSTLKRIRYVASGNLPPTAVASQDKSYGPAPLTVQFTGTNSTDPEGLPLSYRWDFGDGSAISTNANPVHVFNAPPGVPTRFDVTLRVIDAGSATNATALIVSVNNTPPSVTITSPVDGDLYPTTADTTYNCTAQVTDAEQNVSQLSCVWQTILHHNNHTHNEPLDTNCTTTTVLAPVGCDGETYFYAIILTVTDSAGLSTTNEVRLYPNCNFIAPNITWKNPAPISSGTALGSAQLNATADVPGTFAYTPPAGTVLASGSNQTLSVTFTPNDPVTYSTAMATVSIDVLAPPSPAAVTNLSVSGVTTNSVSLLWTAPGDHGNTGTAASYDLRYSTSPITVTNWPAATQASAEPAPAPAGTAQAFTITGLVSGVTYYFALKASDETSDLSPLSNVASATTTASLGPPAPPTGLRVTAVASNEIDLVWTDHASNEDGFKVERSANGLTFAQITTTPINVTNAADRTVVPGSINYYRVRAYNAAGDSAYSNTNSAQAIAPTGSLVTILIASNAVWKYLDNGSNQSNAWTSLTFNDSAWASGPAQLGYGSGHEATTNSYGPNANAKYITTYYRRHFTVSDPTAINALTASVQRDDGAVVYLNGLEVFRSNMPTGSITYLTLAASGVSGTNKTGFHDSPPIDPGNLVPGDNVVAVEVHQYSASSSSMDFNLQLIATNNPCSALVTISLSPTSACPNSTGNQAIGPAGATTYSWSITNGTIMSSTNIQTITYTAGAAGNVGLTLRMSNAPGCTATSAANVPILVDTLPPTVTCSTNITITATGNCPVVVSFPVTGDDNCSLATLMANPPSGSVFPVGTNAVIVTATDAAGNSNSCSFSVIILPGLPPPLNIVRGSTNVVLSWPDAFGCYTLQFTPVLSSPPSTTIWSRLSVLLQTNGGSIFATDNASVSNRFYKLAY